MRFSEFKDSFEITSVGKLVKVKMGQSPDSSSYNTDGIGVPLVQGNADIQDRTTKPQRYTSLPSSKYCDVGDTLISVRAPVGSISKSNVRACIGRGIASLGKIDNFLYQFFLLKENSWGNIAQGSTFSCITAKDIENLIIGIPTVEERNKIGSFLALLDERIQTQNKIIKDLKSSVKAILDCFFDHETNSKIGNYITEISERNKNDFDYPVFSVSNKKGFIPQQEQFEDKVIASDNKSSYKIVRKNMFAYNPARINVGSIGLYELDSPCIVSPMYNCFGVKEIDPMYLSMYFKSSFFINEMSKRLEGSVRMCLTMGGLKNLPIYIPSMDKMNKFSNVYLVINRKLQNSIKLLNLYLKQKDYLLSNLFI